MRREGVREGDEGAAGGGRKRWRKLLPHILSAHLIWLLSCAGSAQRGSISQNIKPKAVVTLSYRLVPQGATPEQVRAISVHLKLFHDQLMRMLGSPRKGFIPFTVYVYENRESFEDAVKGFSGLREGDFMYKEGSQELYMAATQEGLRGLGRFHVRIFLCAACRHFPPWVIEGFVEFFGTGMVRAGGTFGYPVFSRALAQRALLGVKTEGVAPTIERQPGSTLSPTQRAIAWALVYWLMKVRLKRNPSAKKRAFNHYLTQVARRGPDVDFFAATGFDERSVKARIINWLERRLSRNEGQ